MRRSLLALLLTPWPACGGFVSLEAFDPLPALEDLDFARVNPATTTAVWELREVVFEGYPQTHRVLGGAGAHAKDTLPPEVREAFEGLAVPSGFAPHCPPVPCFYYIASLDADGIHAWTTGAGVGEFLGTIDSREEAVLLVLGHGFQWSATDLRAGAIRVVAEGYELVVTRLVSGCAPFQVNRYLVLVRTSGQLTTLAEDVWSREDACV